MEIKITTLSASLREEGEEKKHLEEQLQSLKDGAARLKVN